MNSKARPSQQRSSKGGHGTTTEASTETTATKPQLGEHHNSSPSAPKSSSKDHHCRCLYHALLFKDYKRQRLDKNFARITKVSFNRIIKRVHPDRNGDPRANSAVLLLTTARKILANSDLEAAYYRNGRITLGNVNEDDIITHNCQDSISCIRHIWKKMKAPPVVETQLKACTTTQQATRAVAKTTGTVLGSNTERSGRRRTGGSGGDGSSSTSGCSSSKLETEIGMRQSGQHERAGKRFKRDNNRPQSDDK